ncbi:gliding motility-associated ABC transporter substrate-binding protein GldG [Nonlabens sp. Ci31]|jgi:gliding-associated putative ABC transporter substrate-binding component GldG|uniref:gliding motility-associated ABC transporter substrate-binding protein GldG n=1 Tax=Nonlabens sp. Ci31 TaxID=2608253 RepID=UPI001462E8F6|nr:gliding motility-associated ABC transporter substrate-binding protein GldG [Nonlabens sp. Ci31]QJP35594.1 gliding motility-associated ABC transporter substrate-binding protein GldG [Nonlabens sp. Ci31]
MKKTYTSFIVVVIVLILLNLLSRSVYQRFDLTKDSRYTLSEETEKVLEQAYKPIIIDVFLDGELPGEFRKLKLETGQFLEELAAIHPNLKYDFINPIEGASQQETEQITAQLAKSGVRGAIATIQEGGKSTKVTVFPYALILYDGKTIAVPLLKTVARATAEERVNSSIQQLEYQFADGLRKASQKKTKTVAFLRDSGTLSDLKIGDFIKSIQEYYRAAPFGIEFVITSDSIQPQQVLKSLNKFDLVVDPKPTEAYSETKKYILDQYLMQGGKLLLAIDPVIMENDSLSNQEAKAYPVPRKLNLDDMLFRYGLRLNNGLVKDLQHAPIALATGQGRNTQYEAYAWPYYPISKTSLDTSATAQFITKNLEDVKFEYTGTIDTLKNGIKKTILLSTSSKTQVMTLPALISLAEIGQEINPETYNRSHLPLAVLAEGSFTSAYKNRVKPVNLKGSLDQGKNAAIVLIADGDVLKNQVDRGEAQELGYDMRTGQLYGNKEFLMNTVNYLLDDTRLIKLRNKDIKIPFLDTKKIIDQKFKWQLINVVLPLLLVAGFGFVFMWLRKRKYAV